MKRISLLNKLAVNSPSYVRAVSIFDDPPKTERYRDFFENPFENPVAQRYVKLTPKHSQKPRNIMQIKTQNTRASILSALLFTLGTVLSTIVATPLIAAEKPVKHLDLPDITSFEKAETVFGETTSKLKSKTELDAEALHDIHMITYSLEKAIAYFADNTKEKKQDIAQEMAEVVELVHLASENNRAEETKVYLERYFSLANTFKEGL